MPVSLTQLVKKLEDVLTPQLFNDYCPNGLQVEGAESIAKLVTGVTASQALIDRAIDEKADALLVHHGFFWKGEAPNVTGVRRRRIKALLQNDINLLAYHLPLDVHKQYGNNARLADLLGIEITGGLEPENPLSVGNAGVLAQPIRAEEFCQHVAEVLGREPLLIAAGNHPIKTIAWCSGGAQDYIDQAAMLGVDAYLSGEISERTTHSARELGVHYIAAGHHATERFGVQALGEFLATEFAIEHYFVDIDNPA